MFPLVTFEQRLPQTLDPVCVERPQAREHRCDVEQVVAQTAEVEVYDAHRPVAEHQVVEVEVAMDEAEDFVAIPQLFEVSSDALRRLLEYHHLFRGVEDSSFAP